MKRLICFIGILGILFALACSCSRKTENALTTQENVLGFDFEGGDIAEIQSNVTPQGFYYKLYIYADTENPNGMDSVLCAKILFSEDELGGCEITDDILEETEDPHINLRFNTNDNWSVYDAYLCNDCKINIITDRSFTNHLFDNDTLFIQCQVSDDINDIETFTFDISKIVRI